MKKAYFVEYQDGDGMDASCYFMTKREAVKFAKNESAMKVECHHLTPDAFIRAYNGGGGFVAEITIAWINPAPAC